MGRVPNDPGIAQNSRWPYLGCSLKPGLRELSLEHWLWQPQSLVGTPFPTGYQASGHGDGGREFPKSQVPPFLPARKTPPGCLTSRRLSARARTLTRSTPASMSVPTSAGRTLQVPGCGDPGSKWRQWLVGGCERPALVTYTWEPWSTVGLLPPALGKSDSCPGTQVGGETLGSLWKALANIPFTLGPQSGASSPPMKSASPSMGLMSPLSSLALSSSWGICCSPGPSPGSATCRVSLGWRAGDRAGAGPGPEMGCTQGLAFLLRYVGQCLCSQRG